VGGDIEIDSVSVSSMGLHDLRSKITILPQVSAVYSCYKFTETEFPIRVFLEKKMVQGMSRKEGK
jgi:hypothetical protein